MLSNTAMKPVLQGALSYCSSFMIALSSQRPENALYLQPLVEPTGNCWFASKALGHNTLDHMVQVKCAKLLVFPVLRQTIHSTSATCLFHAGVNEQLIIKRTGHRSLDGVRSYKCTSEHQQVALSDIINLSVLEPKRLNLDNNQQQMIGAHLSIQGCTGCTTNVNYRSTYKFQLQLFTTDYDSCD